MSKENFGDNAHKRQIEISTAWDRIEQGLHEDTFWGFLNQDDNTETRIDLLFGLLADEYNLRLGFELDPKDKLFPFLVFSQMQKTNTFVETVWNDVEAIYSEFRSWYADLDKYHIIGFLTACGVKLQDIRRATVGLRKSEVRTKLLELIKRTIGKIDWENLEYGKSKVRNILLLFNIATLVSKGEKQYRFPFNLYKDGKWDIEHIHAIKDDLPNSAVDCKDYLQSLKSEFEYLGNDEIAENIGKFLADKDVTKLNFRSACVDFYAQLTSQCKDLQEDNDIRNLTLLNADINRGYRNVTFMQKRGDIIEYEGKGWFIPPCTKNVFLKYYSSDPTSHRWSEQDRDDYTRAMQATISVFLGGKSND